jgi:hypothetical protein
MILGHPVLRLSLGTGIYDHGSVNLISLKHLKINKKASGRFKDLNDLENLPC